MQQPEMAPTAAKLEKIQMANINDYDVDNLRSVIDELDGMSRAHNRDGEPCFEDYELESTKKCIEYLNGLIDRISGNNRSEQNGY